MEKKYQIFISSTYTDLVEARTKVRDAILSMYHFPVGMELFGAANEEQWQIISETIDSSDYYVLIIGQRYGSVIPEGSPDAGISYTEKEFRYALEKQIPILAFLIDDSVPVKPEFVEQDYPDKLKAFKAAVKTNRLVEWWKTPDDLAQKVTAALYKQITRTKRTGWIRSDSVDIEASLKAMTELTARNQQLTDENQALLFENQKLKQNAERRPNLVVTFFVDTSDEEETEDPLYSHRESVRVSEDGKTIHVKVGHVATQFIEAQYLPLKPSDFVGKLRGQVTEEEIREYNAALPSKEELSAYLEEYRAYHMVMDHGIASIFRIRNMGTAKATDVSAAIAFPEEIQVYVIEEVRDMEEPKAPKRPKDLQQVAYERAHKAELIMERMYAKFDQLAPARMDSWPSIDTVSVGNSIYESVEVFDNTVEIETRRGILHTRSDWFGGIYIVPMKPGVYKAKVTLMCAEYEEPEERELTFICE